MTRLTLWTRRRFTGITLLVSCLLYVGAGVLLPKDPQGNSIVTLPLRSQLLVVFAHPQLWQWDLSLYIGGVVVMLLGLALLTLLFWDAGDQLFSPTGTARLSLRSSTDGHLPGFPPGCRPCGRAGNCTNGGLAQLLPAVPRMDAGSVRDLHRSGFLSTCSLWRSDASTRVLPHWVGWLAIVYGLAGLGFVGVTGDADPFLHLVLPLVIGILLLPARSRGAQSGARREERPAVAPTTTLS